jgi:hypothetical protein
MEGKFYEISKGRIPAEDVEIMLKLFEGGYPEEEKLITYKV